MITVSAAQKKLPSEHVPAGVAHGKVAPLGHLAGTNELRLAIGLPMRHADALTNLLRDLYDPASPQYHQYLTPAEFTERFGPTPEDYAAVTQFAKESGFKVVGTHPNRLLLDVTGKAADVERAFHVRLNTYKHPKEKRNFFAPDTEPTVDVSVPVLHVSGLDDLYLPHPNVQVSPVVANGKATPQGGSGPGGGFIGADFRKAYIPETQLTGAGQNIALLQFDGFYRQDMTNYANAIGLANLPRIIVVPIDGGVVTPGSGVVEVSLDIEMAMAMAPGISNIYVYEAPNPSPWVDLLSRMANDNLARQLSCSWGGGGPNATAEQIFQQMAAQGQTFFNASGDSDAFTGAITFPSESPNITQVGGTTLMTDGSGNYTNETVWNQSNGVGSSGGISTTVPIPAWQTGIDMTTNLGSTTMRNVPDVALTAQNIYIIYGNGLAGMASGTSCAAPLWAGFMALANEQAATAAKPPAGFINPAVYALGQATNYNDCFHDTTVGNNYWTSSPTNFPATPGYDLCTGWGTPVGQALMTALVGLPEPLGVLPDRSFTASGVAGGPFSVTFQNFTLTNFSDAPLNWAILNTTAWLDNSTNSGTLAVTSQVPVTVSLNSAANSLVPGMYVATVGFTNETSGILQNHLFTLFIADPLVLQATNAFVAKGPVEGPFVPANFSLTLTNQGGTNFNWAFGNVPSWLSVSAGSGTLAAGDATNIDLELVGVGELPTGVYSAVLAVTNVTWGSVQSVPVRLEIGQSIVQNGGFETGDFTDWTLVGDTVIGHMVYNVVATESNFPGIVHSGTYGAFLGQGSYLATLTQTLPTVPGQPYQLSFWLNNPVAGSPQEFATRWNGTNLIDLVNPPVLTWTNYQFVVIALDASTDLQFAEQNDPNYFGFDDVSVTPVPPLHFKTTAISSNEFSLAWNSLAGLNYEVQVTTNLVPADWETLTSITAGTNVCSFVDTNIVSDFGSRFYRLVLIP